MTSAQQTPSAPLTSAADTDLPSAEGLKALTEVRVEVVKVVLQLRPDQNQMWPAVEAAIRERSTARHARLAKIATQANNTNQRNIIQLMRDRSEALTQRAEALKKLADAWQPLHATLDEKQKSRLAVLAAYGLSQLMYATEDDEENDD
jgi:zinc resistance-associated protein